MKINTITRTVKVTISNAEVLKCFIQAVAGDAVAASESGGKQWAFYRALGHLIGITDVEAVNRGNYDIMDKENHITVEEFRCWLPTVFAEFARAMLEVSDGD